MQQLLGLLLFISCTDLSCASTSTSDFSKAAYTAKSAGISSSNSSKQFFMLLFHDGSKAAFDCILQIETPKTTSGADLDVVCNYVNWIVFWFLFALILAILLVVVSMGFCFGRWFCNCCCQPCGSPACGGNRPTVTYTTGWAIFHNVVYISALASVLALTVVGFICCMETSTAVTRMGQEVLSSLNFTSELLNEIGPNILRLSPSVNSIISLLNQRLDYGIVASSSATVFDQSLKTSDAQVQELQFFVEGCYSSVPMCSYQQNPAGWNQCTNGSHATGNGAVMSSGKTNPACRDQNGNNRPCPCCSNCSITRGLLNDARLGIPWANPGKRISRAEIDRFLQDVSNFTTVLVHPLQTFVLDAEESVTRFFATVEDNKGIRIGVSIAVWALGWVIVTFALLGIFLASYSKPACTPASSLRRPGNFGFCLHWTAFSMAVFWVTFVTLPLFAAVSIVSIPLADLCKLVPRTGEDPSQFLEIFSVANPDLTAAFRGCVLAPNGSIFDYSTLTKTVSSTFDTLREIENKLKIAQLWSVQEQSALVQARSGYIIQARGWLKSTTITDDEFHSASYCNEPTCIQDFVTYRDDLQKRLDAMKSASDDSMKILEYYNNAFSELQQNIQLLDDNVEDRIATLRQEFSLSVANCAGVNSHYEKLKETLCGDGPPGIATGLEAAWGVLFVVSLLWIPLLFCMCQATKHADQVRYGSLELQAEALEENQFETGDTVNVRILLGAPYNKAGTNKIEANAVARICLEVRDRLAVGADIPPKYFKVTSPGANNSTLPLDVRVEIGSFWINNSAHGLGLSEKESKIQDFVLFLTASANDARGAFQGESFQADQSAWTFCKTPWKGYFPPNPLLSTVGFEVVRGLEVPFSFYLDKISEHLNQISAATREYQGKFQI